MERSAGVVAAAYPLAAAAGRDVLRAGGSAVDAAVATNAVLAVTQPHMCGVGGDLLLLVSEPGGTTHVLNATGRSGAAADVTRLGSGAERVPSSGAASITVPGCVDGWWQAWQRFGRRPWRELFAPAIRYCMEGFEPTSDLRRWFTSMPPVLDAFENSESLRRTFLPEGQMPGVIVQADLGRTLTRVADSGSKGFYTGPVAAAIADSSIGAGGFVDEGDLAEHESTWSEPIVSDYGGYRVETTGDNTPGLQLHLALAALERRGRPPSDPAARVHEEVEAIKAVLPLTSQLADPDVHRLDAEELLSESVVTRIAAGIGPRASEHAGCDATGDTTAFSIVDGDGMTVAGIQSLYGAFGSGVVAPGTGVVLQNRGAGFCVTPGHPNVLAPAKRPAHTLMATTVFREDGPAVVFSTMGGAGQPQTTLQVLRRILDDRIGVQAAINAPRWLYGAMFEGEPPNSVQVEQRFGQDALDHLLGRGHQVQVLEAFSSRVGHAQGIVIDEQGTAEGGADIRCDGSVASL